MVSSGVYKDLLAPYKSSLSSPKPSDQTGHLSIKGSSVLI